MTGLTEDDGALFGALNQVRGLRIELSAAAEALGRRFRW